MPAFDEALQATLALAGEWVGVQSTLYAYGAASDHDPSWGPDDDAAYNAAGARQAEIGRQIIASLGALDRDHKAAWRAYLERAVAKLRVIEAGNATFSYECDSWETWLRGTAPTAEVFARGIDVLRRAGFE